MNRTDILTLSDFCEPLKKKYPEAVQHYCDWVDELKQDIHWHRIFACEVVDESVMVAPCTVPFNVTAAEHSHVADRSVATIFRPHKAHELPAFFQVGLLMQYIYEHDKYASFRILDDWAAQIEIYFKNRQYGPYRKPS